MINKNSFQLSYSTIPLSRYAPKILVVGDLMIDHYLWGECERISPEAPVQVVDIKKEESLLGGAGNVLNNLKAFEAEVGVISVVGDDKNGEWLEKRLQERGIKKIALIKEKGRVTSKKSRIIASHQQIVRVDKESKNDISKSSEKKILEILRKKIDDFDLILLSDYAKGVLTYDLTQEIINLAKEKIPVFVDPKGRDYSKYTGADLITPNKKEASLASGIDIIDDKSLKEAGFYLKNRFNLKNVIITLSEEGMAIFEDKMEKIPTAAREVYDVTGAGDTVLAALGFAKACGKNLKEAAYFANLAAGVVVGKVGAATATIEEIEEYESSLHKSSSDEHIKSFEEIKRVVEYLKNKNKKIVFTNGCFDILHIGHVKYLQKAKQLGDVLIVGLNSDESVRRLKGKDRPVNPEYDRAYLLAALEPVDYVVIFNEDTPYELIKIIEPDVLVKGTDYEGKEVVGSDIAKEVRLIEFVEGKSTSKIIEKVRNR
ncbi:D-glycero-beta-D-manno-heptose-7-phosphate kinase [Nitrosophilus kaiyonis]|uniref:D-glycero-beta-D-manno-heptose-7-phosphate kinase n=1 Tax=Nitrosophilus kaiyonis TaxID=2930200 RepID=UPI00248F5A44|nr:D-glycero-beta-D-manno-heptose-7-phosphate kinase [Nitrosophilus kaiyonis]